MSTCIEPILELAPTRKLARDVVTPISPWGICRQVIREFCDVDMPVLLVPGDYPHKDDDQGGVVEETVGGLLPLSLGPSEFERVRGTGKG